jgi:hypothetical protein
MVNVSVAMNQHATIAKLLEVVFTVWSTLRLHSKDKWENWSDRGHSQWFAVRELQSEQWQFMVYHEESPLLAANTQQRLATTD